MGASKEQKQTNNKDQAISTQVKKYSFVSVPGVARKLFAHNVLRSGLNVWAGACWFSFSSVHQVQQDRQLTVQAFPDFKNVIQYYTGNTDF